MKKACCPCPKVIGTRQWPLITEELLVLVIRRRRHEARGEVEVTVSFPAWEDGDAWDSRAPGW